MRSRARLLGHPIHQMLIVFPLGLLATSVIFDLLTIVRHDGKWSEVAFWMIGAGIVGGLLAAVFGVIDWLGIPKNSRAYKIASIHGLGNIGVLLLFGASWVARQYVAANPSTMAVIFSVAGFLLSAVTGWLGGELVDRLGVGVDEGANVNAPSSLSGKPATQ